VKSKHWHRCPHCSFLNEGERSPSSKCRNANCQKSTGTYCPRSACGAELSGPHLCCPICHYHIAWVDFSPERYEPSRHVSLYGNLAEMTVPHVKELWRDSCSKQTASSKDRIIYARSLERLDGDVVAEFARQEAVLVFPSITKLKHLQEFLRFVVKGKTQSVRGLFVDGIRSLDGLSDELLVYIKRFKGTVSFSGLNALDSREFSQALCERRCKTILNGITKTSDQCGELLAYSRGEIYLDGLAHQNCPPILQARFWNREFYEFRQFMGDLKPALARGLRRTRRRKEIDLLVTELHPRAAQELCGEEACRLKANRLRKVGKPLAEILGGHPGEVHLDSLDEIDAEVLLALGQTPKKVSLRGVKKLPVEAFVSLVRSRAQVGKKVRVRVNSFGAMTAEQAGVLSREHMTIQVASGKWLTPEVASVLANGNAEVVVHQKETVSRGVHEVLRGVKGSSLRVSEESELQRRLKTHLRHRVVHLTTWSFEEEDVVLINDHVKEDLLAKVVFPSREAKWDLAIAQRLSECRCDFKFPFAGKVGKSVWEELCLHSRVMSFERFELTSEECELIAEWKDQGVFRFFVEADTELTDPQKERLAENKRIEIYDIYGTIYT
jgi:hypothetical protein